MDISAIIMQEIEQSGSVTPAKIQQRSGVSRQQVHRITRKLVQSGQIVRLGATRNLHFVAPNLQLQAAIGARPLSFARRLTATGLDENTAFRHITQTTNVLELLPLNVTDILRFAFTEMLNNAIDHSEAHNVYIEGSRTLDEVELEVKDAGIGLLENFRRHFKLANEREALLEVVKGKLTTRSDRHSGQGLFFTSRAVDMFVLESGSLRLTVNNRLNDTFIETKRRSAGTLVSFVVSTKSEQTMAAVFGRFSSIEAGFFGTEYRIKLAGYDDAFISRSQAKMVMNGMDRFNRVTLDFTDVRLVGQGFADEVLRVWQDQHPAVTIDWTNASDDVAFMMDRVERT